MGAAAGVRLLELEGRPGFELDGGLRPGTILGLELGLRLELELELELGMGAVPELYLELELELVLGLGLLLELRLPWGPMGRKEALPGEDMTGSVVADLRVVFEGPRGGWELLPETGFLGALLDEGDGLGGVGAVGSSARSVMAAGCGREAVDLVVRVRLSEGGCMVTGGAAVTSGRSSSSSSG